MKYTFILGIAAILSLLSSFMTAFGMTNLFSAAGMFILTLFVIIDLGRFILFNFTVNEWNNLRSVKYVICLILALLFCYSGAGIYAKLDSLVAPETRQAMVDMAKYLKEADNAVIKHTRSEDLAKMAQEEYKSAMDWNRMDYDNCIARANKNKWSENKCNNTKRALDNKASIALKEALAKADQNLQEAVETTEKTSKNQSEIASILTTICKFTQKSCDSYDKLQDSLTILIFLVIVGTDFLQIAIVLAVHTRKNKILPTNQVLEKCVPEEEKRSEKRVLFTRNDKEKCGKYQYFTKQSNKDIPNDRIKTHQNAEYNIAENGVENLPNDEIVENLTEINEPVEEKIQSFTIPQKQLIKEPNNTSKKILKKKFWTPLRPFHFSGPKPK